MEVRQATTRTLLLCCLVALVGARGSSIREWPLDLQVGESNGVPLVEPPYRSAGYLPLNHEHLFYFYIQQRHANTNAPLVFWTNGGPGCSSLFGLFSENGPFVIQEDLSLRYSEFGWDQAANLLYVDQPLGTGFSTSSDDADRPRLERQVGNDMLTFFHAFMDLHPDLQGNDLFLSGESYAGHYLPAIARAIYDANKSGEFMHLNLKGVFVGNPWTAPLVQSLSYPAFGAAHGIITQEEAATYLKNSTLCRQQSLACNTVFDQDVCVSAGHSCAAELLDTTMHNNPRMDVYDIRKDGSSPTSDHNLLHKFLNSPAVQEQLGVHATWEECNKNVWGDLQADIMVDMSDVVKSLLNEGVPYLVYVGDQDFICNWFGQKAWLASLEWNKADQWTGILSQWKVQTKTRGLMGAGDCEIVPPLSFCTIYDSGHMVPEDQPEMAYIMMRTFIAGGAFILQESPTQKF